jgi:carboxyl-terminal processing protease
MRNKKLQVWLPLFLAIIMISGMFFGFKLHQQTGSQSFFAKNRATSLQEVLDLIRNKYVDSIGVDSLQADAISSVVNHLDPHSVYIPATDVSEENESLVGNFQGIGVEFNIFSDTVNVIYVIPDGPSDNAGLQIGDKILKVDDSSIVSKTLPSAEIKKMIRGKSGSKVKLTILRGNKIQDLQVTRGTIPLPALDAAYMMDGKTGYIKLNKFSETTYREFMQSMETLQKQGLQKLILDLRGNGGGFINQAVNIADEFLDDDKLIVYTQGTNIDKQEYRAKKDGVFEKGNLVILVDEMTASASEILAGAIQDWDRGTIVGRRTFGKGLVQEQYQLNDGSALRLTVARYYTPSGRSIQRPYGQGKKIYMEEIYERYENGEMINPDSIHLQKNKTYKTSGGRLVYGGGGIMPDVFVPLDTSIYTRSVTKLYLDGRFNNFVYQYYITHLPQFNQFKSPTDFINKFSNSQDAWNQLVVYAMKDSINLNKVPASDKQNIEERIKAYLARLKYRNQGFYQVYNNYDPVVQKAKELLSK